MKAPMSDNIKKILSDPRKSRLLAGQILLSRQTGRNAILKVNNKRIELVRTVSYSKG